MTDRSDNAIWRQGRVWISAVGLITAVAGWLVYEAMMAPQWMRNFSLEMTARATIVSDRSKETAFSTMRGRAEPDSPYICFASLAAFEWDRVFFIPSGGPIFNSLARKDWNDGVVTDLNARLESDPRYQLIAFEKDGVVVEHGYYFTIWADLSALTRPEGYGPAEAVFVAESNGTTFTVEPVSASNMNPCIE